MKIAVIILAAGKGTRLHPLTEDMPKCLVPVAGTPLLLHMVETLEAAQRKQNCIITLYLVTGFRADAIQSFLSARKNNLDIRTVPNPDYAATNNLYSLRLALDAVGKDRYDRFLWANGDCIYDPAIIERALAANSNAVLCDGRYPYNDESMKIATAKGRILGIGKGIPPGPGTLVSIDCYAFTPNGWAEFDRFLAAYCTGPRQNMWAELALHDFMREENAKPAGCVMTPLDIGGLRWAEIDNAQDLALAERLWSGAQKKRAPA